MHCQQRVVAFGFRLLIAGLCCSGIVNMSGCQAVNAELPALFGEPLPAQTTANASSISSDAPRFSVELRESGRKPELVQLPLSGNIFIQQALDQTGATRRFSRMKIELYRRLPDGGGHRLDIGFDRAKHRVPAGSDYAVLANDRIVVTEDTSTILDDMLSSLGIASDK